MPKISKEKRDRISEQILHYLFTLSPSSEFTNRISVEIARDEEFVKSLLLDLEKKKLVILIDKNKVGKTYIKRQRWRLSNQVYDIYSKHQQSSIKTVTPQKLEDLSN